MFALTDVVVQRLEYEREIWHGEGGSNGSTASIRPDSTLFEVDMRRTATQAAFGAYYGVVHAHLIWGGLERVFGAVRGAGVVIPGGLLGGAIARVALDQLVTGTPLFNAFRHRLLPAQAALFGWSSFMSYTGARKIGQSTSAPPPPRHPRPLGAERAGC